jgi:hypothetical protein
MCISRGVLASTQRLAADAVDRSSASAKSISCGGEAMGEMEQDRASEAQPCAFKRSPTLNSWHLYQ